MDEEKMCEYCTADGQFRKGVLCGKDLIVKAVDFGVLRSEAMYTLIINDPERDKWEIVTGLTGGRVTAERAINFCPICGRKLGGTETKKGDKE